MSITRFAALWSTLLLAADKPSNPAKQQVYWRFLQDLPIDLLEQAAREWIETRSLNAFDKFPSIAILRDSVERRFGKLTPNEQAARAFEIAAEHGVSHSSPFQFADPLIHHAINSLGGIIYWSSLGRRELSNFVRPRFLEAYKMFLANPPTRKARPFSIGVLDTERNGMKLIECDYVTTNPTIEHVANEDAAELILSLSKTLSAVSPDSAAGPGGE